MPIDARVGRVYVFRYIMNTPPKRRQPITNTLSRSPTHHQHITNASRTHHQKPLPTRRQHITKSISNSAPKRSPTRRQHITKTITDTSPNHHSYRLDVFCPSIRALGAAAAPPRAPCQAMEALWKLAPMNCCSVTYKQHMALHDSMEFCYWDLAQICDD